MMRLLAKPVAACESNELWRGQLHLELVRLKQTQDHMKIIEERLDMMGKISVPVNLLTKIDGVGMRCAEAIVATLGDPGRFKNRKQVAAYIGLCPRVEQSGDRTVHGRITKCGNSLLRTLLVEVAWLGVRRDTWMGEIFDQIARGDKNRKKRAVIAVARRLLVKCWAMLRDLNKPPASTPDQPRKRRTKISRAPAIKRAA
jgi:transposase